MKTYTIIKKGSGHVLASSVGIQAISSMLPAGVRLVSGNTHDRETGEIDRYRAVYARGEEQWEVTED